MALKLYALHCVHQENMKMVLEGSCFILIPIKPVARECAKLMDQAIPQIIEALASQMNPQVVCATAGLCNSVRINALIAKYKVSSVPWYRVVLITMSSKVECYYRCHLHNVNLCSSES